MKNGSPIHSVIEFYDDMAAQGLMPPLGFQSKPIGAVLKLKEDGDIRAFMPLSNKERMMLPNNIKSRSGVAPYPCFAHDTQSYFCSPQESKNDGFVKGKWPAWRQAHLDVSHLVEYPSDFKAFLAREEAPLGKVVADSNGKEPVMGWIVIELSDGRLLHEIPAVQAFWNPDNSLVWEHEEAEMGCSSISGNQVPLTPFHAPFGNVIGGAKACASFGSVHSECYRSFGVSKGAFAVPMSPTESMKIAATMRELYAHKAEKKDENASSVRVIELAHQRRIGVYRMSMAKPQGGRLAPENTVVLAWGPVKGVEMLSFDADKHETPDDTASQAIQSIKHANIEAPTIEENSCVNFMSISCRDSGRLCVDDFWSEETPAVVAKWRKWYDATTLDVGLSQPVSSGLYEFVKGLSLGDYKGMTDQEQFIYRIMSASIMGSKAIPDHITKMAAHAVWKALVATKDEEWKRGVNRILAGTRSPARALRTCLSYNDSLNNTTNSTIFKKGSYKMNNETNAFKLGKNFVVVDSAIRAWHYALHRNLRVNGAFTNPVKDALGMIKQHPQKAANKIFDASITYGGTVELNKVPERFSTSEYHEFLLGISCALAERRYRNMIKKQEEAANKTAKVAVEE